MGGYQLAQINLAYALGAHDDPRMAGFMARLDEINRLAESSPGFAWRYVTDSRDPAQRELGDPLVLFNMSVWESVEALHAFTYRSAHAQVFATRRQWFADWKDQVGRLPELGAGMPFLALWWVHAGHRPTPAEGLEKLRILGRKGPGPAAFTLRRPFTPRGEAIVRD